MTDTTHKPTCVACQQPRTHGMHCARHAAESNALSALDGFLHSRQDASNLLDLIRSEGITTSAGLLELARMRGAKLLGDFASRLRRTEIDMKQSGMLAVCVKRLEHYSGVKNH